MEKHDSPATLCPDGVSKTKEYVTEEKKSFQISL